MNKKNGCLTAKVEQPHMDTLVLLREERIIGVDQFKSIRVPMKASNLSQIRGAHNLAF